MSGKLTNQQIAQRVTSLIPQFLRDFITAHELFEKAVAKRTDGLDATDSTDIRKILNKQGLGDAQKRLYSKDGNNRFIYSKLQVLPKATQQRFYELIVKPMMTGQNKASVKSASTFDAFFTTGQKTQRDKLMQQLDTIDMQALMDAKPVPIDTIKFGGDLFLNKLKEYVDGGQKPQISATERLDEYAKFIGMPETSQTLTTPAPAPAPIPTPAASPDENDADDMTRAKLDNIKKGDDGKFYDEDGESVSVAQIQGFLDSLPANDSKREEWAEKLSDSPTTPRKKLRGKTDPSSATPAQRRSQTGTAEAEAPTMEDAPTATATPAQAPTPAPTQPEGPSEEQKPDYRTRPTEPAQPFTGTQPSGNTLANPDEPGPVFLEGSSTGMAQTYFQEADRGAPNMGPNIGETVAQLNQKEQRDVMKMKLPEIKRRIEALHIAYDNLIPEFRENAHTKSKNDALQTKDIKIARRHLIKMLQRIQAYYDANTALKVGVIIPANVLMRQLFEQQSMMQNPMMLQQQQQPMLENDATPPEQGDDIRRRLTRTSKQQADKRGAEEAEAAQQEAGAEGTIAQDQQGSQRIGELMENYMNTGASNEEARAFVDFMRSTGIQDEQVARFYYDNASRYNYRVNSDGNLEKAGRPTIIINNTYNQAQVNNQFIQSDQRQQNVNVGYGGTGSGLPPQGAQGGAGMAGMTGMGGQMTKPHAGDVLHKSGDKFGHAMSVSTYYRNSGMEAFQRKGVARHSIVPQPMRGRRFNLVKDPRPLPNVPAPALRALDNRPRGKPKGFKIKT